MQLFGITFLAYLYLSEGHAICVCVYIKCNKCVYNNNNNVTYYLTAIVFQYIIIQY